MEEELFRSVALDKRNSFAFESAAELADSKGRIDVIKITILGFFIRGVIILSFVYQTNIFANAKAMRKGLKGQIYGNLFKKYEL